MNFFSRLLSAQAITFEQGKAKTCKGKHSERLLFELSSICHDHGVLTGEIWIAGNNRITFSPEIPEKLHQSFRNIITNFDH